MDYFQFRDLAIYSSQRYYAYLKAKNKGLVTIKVSRVIQEGRVLRLLLKGKMSPKSLDSIELLIATDTSPISNDLLHPIDYEVETCQLILRPRKDIAARILSEKCDDLQILSDLRFLVRRVEDWYEHHTSPLGPPAVPPAVPVPAFSELAGGTPSAEQYAAVRTVLTSPFSYVWGAPGTGKTRYVLSNCVLAYLRQDRKVLLVAPTNNALDQMLSGVLEVFAESGTPLGCVRRLGVPSDTLSRQYPQVCERTSSDGRRQDLDRRITQLQNQEKRLLACQYACGELEQLLALQTSLEEISAKYESARIPEKIITDLRNSLAPLDKEISTLDRQISELEIWLDSFHGKFSRLFLPRKYFLKTAALEDARGARADTLQNLTLCRQRLSDYEAAKSAADKEYLTAYHELCSHFISICDASRIPTLKRLYNLSAEELPQVLAQIIPYIRSLSEAAPELSQTTLEELRNRIRTLEEEHAHLIEIEGRDWADVRVLAMTIDRYISSNILSDYPDFRPEHVFMDEAAYCSLIKGFTLLAMRLPLTLLGDHAQLPPVCEMGDSEIKKEGNQPVFLWAQSAIHLESVFRLPFGALYQQYSNCAAPIFAALVKCDLSTTYRFGPSLAQVLSEYIYPHFKSAKVGDLSIKYIDAPASENPPSDPKRTSRSECVRICNLVRTARLRNSDFAVLTPYKKQIEMLSKYMPSVSVSGHILTVHASQGREFDTVILSPVDTTKKFFVNSSIPVGRCVLNTAISRVKNELILVLDYDYWSHAHGQFLQRLLEIATPYYDT